MEKTRIFVVNVLLSLFSFHAVYAQNTIKIPIFGWENHSIMGHVVGGIFKRSGENVEYIDVHSRGMYRGLDQGDISLDHQYFTVLESESMKYGFGEALHTFEKGYRIEDVGDHAARYQRGIAVPNWIIDENKCPGLPNWTALKGSAAIFGNRIAVDQYMLDGISKMELQRMGLNVLPVTIVEHEKMIGANTVGRPILTTFESPSVGDKYGYIFIQFPEGTCIYKGAMERFCGNRSFSLKKLASQQFRKESPKAFKIFQKISFTPKHIGEMLYLKRQSPGKTDEQVAQEWLKKNKGVWKPWIDGSEEE